MGYFRAKFFLGGQVAFIFGGEKLPATFQPAYLDYSRA
jgi:hypothetical protein